MSKPRNAGRTRVWPLVIIAVIVLTIATGAGISFSLLESVRFTTQWKPQITVSVPSQGTFEYGWIPQNGPFDGPFGRGDSTYLLWKRPAETLRFRISEGGDPLGPDVRIHLGKGGEGLWIERSYDGKRLAALEFGTGRFWDINQLPGFNTEPNSAAIQAWPRWAVRPGSKQLYPTAIVPAPSR